MEDQTAGLTEGITYLKWFIDNALRSRLVVKLLLATETGYQHHISVRGFHEFKNIDHDHGEATYLLPTPVP
jgi:hypothetical protein